MGTCLVVIDTDVFVGLVSMFVGLLYVVMLTPYSSTPVYVGVFPSKSGLIPH